MLDEDIKRAPALLENERLDRVNDGLMLIQRTDGLTFGTDALLLAAFIEGTDARALEIGGGTGIISLLLLSRDKLRSVDVCEVQSSFAELCRRNARLNALDGRMTVKEADVRELEADAQYDAVFTNPPYMKSTSGRANITTEKNTARHEVMGGIDDFLAATRRMLKYGGRFYCVYRPERLSDLFAAMRAATVEPKRMTLVFADTHSEPSVVLVEGRMGGGVGLSLTRPLVLYTDREHTEYSNDMKYILNEGNLPEDFYTKNRRR